MPLSIALFWAIARRRQDQWASRDAAFAHLRPKRVFAGLSDEALQDIVQDGLVKTDRDVRLACPKAWEARVYEEHSDVLDEELIGKV